MAIPSEFCEEGRREGGREGRKVEVKEGEGERGGMERDKRKARKVSLGLRRSSSTWEKS